MTKTEKLARELFHAFYGCTQDHADRVFNGMSKVSLSAWRSIARYVLRREARLRKAKR